MKIKRIFIILLKSKQYFNLQTLKLQKLPNWSIDKLNSLYSYPSDIQYLNSHIIIKNSRYKNFIILEYNNQDNSFYPINSSFFFNISNKYQKLIIFSLKEYSLNNLLKVQRILETYDTLIYTFSDNIFIALIDIHNYEDFIQALHKTCHKQRIHLTTTLLTNTYNLGYIELESKIKELHCSSIEVS